MGEKKYGPNGEQWTAVGAAAVDPVHPPMPVGHMRACGCPECVAWLEAHEPAERGQDATA